MTTAIATTTVFARESFDSFFADAGPLIKNHYEEIARYQDIPLVIDVARYQDIDARGNLRVYTVRATDAMGDHGLQRLVGYALFLVAPNAHYSTSLQATQDVLYIDPEYRRGSLGLRLVRWADKQLTEDGVQVVYHHVKADHLALALVLERDHYELVEVIYCKRLDVDTGRKSTLRQFMEKLYALFLGNRGDR